MNKDIEKIVDDFVRLAKADKLKGMYKDIPEEAYNHPRFPAIRSSVVKSVAKKSFWHAQEQEKSREEKEHLVIGKALHERLEGVSEQEVKKKFNLLQADIVNIRQMVNSVRSHPDFMDCYEGSMKEVTFFGKCPFTGLLLRCRCDLFNYEMNIVTDYKTSADASPDKFPMFARKFGYRMSACHYAATINYAIGRNIDEFRMIAVESKTPFFAALYYYAPDFFNQEQEAFLRALWLIREGLDETYFGYTRERIELRY